MEMKYFKKDFVERTREIIIEHGDSYRYNVTLLLNCLSGLITLPTENTRKTDEKFREMCVQKMKDMKVIIKETSEYYTFRTIRNAAAHMHIEPKASEKCISEIVFFDMSDDVREKMRYEIYDINKCHTVLRFSIAQLKEFALFVADLHLKRYRRQ